MYIYVYVIMMLSIIGLIKGETRSLDYGAYACKSWHQYRYVYNIIYIYIHIYVYMYIDFHLMPHLRRNRP